MRPDPIIHALAAAQHGIVTRQQLLAAGLTSNQVDFRSRSGSLEAVHRGVFRVGPVRAQRWREMAGVLASGGGAVLSHWSAARVWQQQPADPGAPVSVTTRGGQRPRRGVRLYRRQLERSEITECEQIPITTVARTVLDLCSVADSRTCEQALADLLARRLVREAELRELLARRPRARGAALLDGLLDATPKRTRSEAEARFLAMIRAAQLPTPEANVKLAGFEVDFLWRKARLVVEVDGFRYHGSAAAFERDRKRDTVLASTGLRVMRITWRQLEEEGVATVVRVAQALLSDGRPLP